MDLTERMNQVNTQNDFMLFVKELREDLAKNPATWDNTNLDDYLNGMEGYCSDKKVDQLSWRMLAEILLASSVYE